MVPRRRGAQSCGHRFPRTRGDGPRIVPLGGIEPAVPPHPRGWSPFCSAPSVSGAGSPAPAGMVPLKSKADRSTRRFPRTRGDGPPAQRSRSAGRRVPPHPRGWSQEAHHFRPSPCGSPAPAGMVPQGWPMSARSSRFPRTRGDGPTETVAMERNAVVPPHPRGWSLDIKKVAYLRRGSPAPAGMVPLSSRQLPTRRRFPRTRGDGPFVVNQPI